MPIIVVVSFKVIDINSRFIKDGWKEVGRIGLSGGGLIRSYGGWEALSLLRREHIECIGDERILGGSNFVESALQEDELIIEPKTRLARKGWTLESLTTWVCNHCSVDQSQLGKRSREDSMSRAKALICVLGVESLGIKSSEIAERLGISRPAVSKWLDKGRKLREQEIGLEEFD